MAEARVPREESTPGIILQVSNQSWLCVIGARHAALVKLLRRNL